MRAPRHSRPRARLLVGAPSSPLRTLCFVRSAAEDSLASARRQPQCTPSVLGLLTQEQVPLQVRQAAAVFFKNVVRQHWA